MEFRLFGGVEAVLDGHRLDLGSTRQRCLLAVLLVEANTAVTVDQLVDRIWSGRPPRHARASLQSYVSRLRRVLDRPGVDAAIDRRGDGYVAVVDERTVDLHLFRHLATVARTGTDDDRVLAVLDEALRLSRAEPFAGLDVPWLDDVRAAVLAERVAVVLDHNEIRLRRGDHHELLAGLRAQAERRPLDERLAGQLMVALYRSGRQADAVDVYQDTRTRLARELGVGPAPALSEVYRRLLVAEPSLGDVLPGPRPASGGLPDVPAPRTGRPDHLAALDAAVVRAADDTTVTIVALSGPGGSGKTWLALRWAHRHVERFPDGQLFADLHGGRSTRSSVLRGFLTALGVEAAALPVDPDAQIGLYRSLTADRRLLVVLDDAADTAQVTPLLPSGASCVVLVTSRDRLTGLVAAHGAHPLPLDTLATF